MKTWRKILLLLAIMLFMAGLALLLYPCFEGFILIQRLHLKTLMNSTY